MTSSDRAKISGYYSNLIATYGMDPRACDYGRAQSQQIKFQVLSQRIKPGQRVLDVGCGFANYADFLESRGLGITYTGIDICPDMIQRARQARPGLELEVASPFDIDGQWDVVSANGIFYLLQEAPWETMRRLIGRMFELAGVCCVFNSLSTWAPETRDGEFQANPEEVLAYCQSLTPYVELDHAYMPHDFCMTLRREAKPSGAARDRDDSN